MGHMHTELALEPWDRDPVRPVGRGGWGNPSDGCADGVRWGGGEGRRGTGRTGKRRRGRGRGRRRQVAPRSPPPGSGGPFDRLNDVNDGGRAESLVLVRLSPNRCGLNPPRGIVSGNTTRSEGDNIPHLSAGAPAGGWGAGATGTACRPRRRSRPRRWGRGRPRGLAQRREGGEGWGRPGARGGRPVLRAWV